MKRSSAQILVVGVITFLAALVSDRRRGRYGGAERSDTLTYQGHTIRLAKAYSTWESYKEDPDNLNTNDLELIEKVMTEAVVPVSFRNREEFIHKMVTDFEFPGYGLSFSGSSLESNGTSLELVELEIPQRNRSRFLVFRRTERGEVKLLDSVVTNWSAFSLTDSNAVVQLKSDKTNLLYFLGSSNVVRVLPLVRE